MARFIFFPVAMAAVFLSGCGNTVPSDGARAEDAPVPEAVWLTDMEDAKARAAQTDRPILVNFTGSDWCPPCLQLKKDVFGTESFLEYASGKLVLLEVDFPRRASQPEELKRKNEELAATFKVEAFPTLVLLNPEGDEVARSEGYMPGGPKRFLEWTESAQEK